MGTKEHFDQEKKPAGGGVRGCCLGPLLLIVLSGACETYRPIEYYPPRSAPRSDRTGRRDVDAFQPRDFPDLPAGEVQAVSTPALEDRYQPAALSLSPTPSSDGTYRIAEDVFVDLRDGTRLVTDFYFPLQDGKHPAILERSPEDRKAPRFSRQLGPLFARAGFVYAVQNVRGLIGSGGFFFPFRNEGADGQDVVQWIAAQPWFSGDLGLMGREYSAYTALLAAIDAPQLKAVIVEDCPSDLFLNGGFYLDGIPMTNCLFAEIRWRLQDAPNLMAELRWDDALFHLPLREMDNVLGHPLFFWDECLLHPSYNFFWEDLSLTQRYSAMDAAVLHIGGWHSQQNLGGTVANFRSMLEADRARGRSGRQAMVLGPWSQGVNSETSLGYYEFTEASRIDENALYLGWFSKWLKGEAEAAGIPPAPVRTFLLGGNTWIDLPDWPPQEVAYEPFFLHSNGKAGTDWDGGSLDLDPPPGFEEIDSFESDPENPVLSEFELGTDDQRPVERREDVLTFTSAPLEQDLTMIGSPQVVLYASTSAPDTDLFVMLTDVDEFGFSRPVSLGVMRVRFRDAFDAPTPVSPADINEYVIDLTPAANRFLKGHSLRLNIMGSYFPFLTRNLNTGSAIGQDSELQRAVVYLLHDFDYPSRLVLPWVP